jgi:hypothetical protein
MLHEWESKMQTEGTSTSRARQLAEDLLDQREALRKSQELREAIARQVTEFEQRFNVRSSEVHDAIREGKLRETHEVCQWLIYHEIVERTGARQDS